MLVGAYTSFITIKNDIKDRLKKQKLERERKTKAEFREAFTNAQKSYKKLQMKEFLWILLIICNTLKLKYHLHLEK